MTVNLKDLLAGGVFFALGLGFAFSSYFYVNLGTLVRMGPGYFPLMTACILMLLGVIIALRSIGAETSPMSRIPWRGLVFVLGSTVVFGLSVRGLGFIPSVALLVGMSAVASRKMRPALAVALMGGVTFFCVAVFYYGVGLPMRLIGPWLGG